MIGALIGAAVSIGSQIYGGIKARKAAQKQADALAREKAENTAWYNRRMNEDVTQRADAQRVLRLAEESIRRRNKETAATQAVVGGTEESVAATKEANAKALADATSQIAAAGEARKDSIEDSYRNQQHNIAREEIGLDAQKAQNTAEAVRQVGATAGNLASAIDSGDSVGKSSAKNSSGTSVTPENVTPEYEAGTPEYGAMKSIEKARAQAQKNAERPDYSKMTYHL